VVKNEVAQLLLYYLTIGGFSMFLQKCYEKEMILRRYYLFLTYLWIRNWRHSDRWKRKILKPLGLCVYCQSFWIVLITYPIIFNIDIYYIISIGGVYTIIELINKIK